VDSNIKGGFPISAAVKNVSIRTEPRRQVNCRCPIEAFHPPAANVRRTMSQQRQSTRTHLRIRHRYSWHQQCRRL